MIRVKAFLKLAGDGKRKTAFISGYRPLFRFSNGIATSGKIELIDRREMKPGESGDVIITFLNKEYLGNQFGIGSKGNFSEAIDPLGEVEILEILIEE